MKTPLSLPAVALILLTEVFAPSACSGGTVTLTGGGVARLFYSSGSRTPDPAWAQAGTFPELSDVEIMDLAGAPEVLMDYWVPFAAAVPVGCQFPQICIA